ncbi:sensor histidine kinase [Phytohabitans houttuyneae]|uniref:histidine kinase n=1 Tax=Phytohabitans houttuyneae TaxID=1076126 RepID=A0A6V8JTM6_9ACTN|nr:HAMP domain-containing sensor histidine kinase [Phytohabitans houttuyneae]GFJ75862.1 two-component sensor histidine kinase [Phytohabitans houttuyneae]
MSSSRRSSWSLRARLLAAVIALLAVVGLTIGVATTFAVRDYLIQQVDAQVQEEARRDVGFHMRGPGDPGTVRPGQPKDTVRAVVRPGGAVSGERADPYADRGRSDITAEQGRALASVPVDGTIRTTELPGLGGYRVVAVKTPDGDSITAIPLGSVNDTVLRLVAIEVAVVGAGVLLAMSVGAFIIGRALRPLRRVAATAGRVAELPLDRGEVALSVRVPEADTDPRTEVGQVGAALNRMLGHVAAALSARQASETRVRQFVADASHELRTPLAAIRGYAEVTRRGRDEVPPDVAHALRRVESESARMTTLVDDLLLLARLDSGRPLETEPVDLSRLLVDAVSDAHVAGPEHRWRLDLPEEAVTVPGDAARLHQVVGNLLANARTHTPPGTEVTVTLRPWDGGGAQVSVLDTGPGIAPELQDDVFERFARGDTSRSRAAGSTGLGLAIVAAVVDAHGGSVEVESGPGRTEFVVRLPGSQ